MKKYVNHYQLERISSRMAKEFGTIAKGDEELYSFLLHPMESNLLKLYRLDTNRNGRRALEAISMCLLKVDGYINRIDYDFSKFVNAENQAFLDGLLMSFDPFTNSEIYGPVAEMYDLKQSETLKEYYKTPIKCLLRIEKSVQTWSQELGKEGYFKFIEEHIGIMIARDDKMDYAIEVKSEEVLAKLAINPSTMERLLLNESKNVKSK
jgi:hypothetical protein